MRVWPSCAPLLSGVSDDLHPRLEALDRKWGRTVTVHDWHHARTKTPRISRTMISHPKAFGGERSRGEIASSMADNNRPVSERRLHQAFDEYTDVQIGVLTRMYRALEHRSLLKHCGEWDPTRPIPKADSSRTRANCGSRS